MMDKKTKSLNMPWEHEYGYSQAVKVGVYLSGQVGHDGDGNVLGEGDMEGQMRTAYANVAKFLAQFSATIENVVDEILFVTDMDAAFPARVKMKQEVFSGSSILASTIMQIQRLVFVAYDRNTMCRQIVRRTRKRPICANRDKHFLKPIFWLIR